MSAPASVAAAALAEGRRALTEVEAYAVAGALGIGVPAHRVVLPGGRVPPLDGLAGEQVVVKVLAAAVAHKTDRGGVRVVPREVGAVESAIAAMSPAFAGEQVLGWLVAEYVAHDGGPGGEVLLGVRRTAEFGPVVVLGIGGTHAEMLAPALPPAVLRIGGREAERARALSRSPAVDLLTTGSRGGAPAVGAGALASFLTRLLARVPGLPPEVVEFEANPVVFTAGGPVALDALARLGSVPAAAPERPAGQIDRLLHPRSMAIVGVSERMNPGRVILENALAAGFPADSVTVVKPGVQEIAGCRCVPDLGALPGKVDLLVLSIGAAAAPEALEEVVVRGAAEGVILIPGGLGERAGSEALAERARAAVADGRRRGNGPVVNGGNSMGIRSVPGRYDATFIPGYKASPSPGAPAAPLAVISQSGAFAIARLDRLTLLRPRYLVTLGNQLDLTAGDYLAFWQDDPAVEVFACYLEGFRPGDGSRFLDAAARIRDRGGVVILYLGGRTPAGAAAVSSHTASLAPDHRVARALTADAGVLTAESLEDFEDLLRLAVLLRRREIAGPGLGAVSNAGFECVALADNPGPFFLPLLGSGTVARIEAVLAGLRLQSLVGVQNPLDLTPMADAAAFGEAAAAVLADPAVEVAVVGCVPLTPVLATLEAGPGHSEDLAASGSLARRLIDLWRATTKPWVLVIDGGSLYDPLARHLEREGVPVFRAADRALRALGRYAAVRLGQ
ncbi:MAG TPA: acetate--CoA ligase family protein [Acidimicrobiia bacterium]|nr:acetate--CoA ligase family protein [Acidimicrobiia bacterium]